MKRFLLAMIPVIVLAYFATGVATVGPGERAVVRRFGHVVARPGPGLWIGFPYGIDRIDRLPMKSRQLAIGATPDELDSNPALALVQPLTGDQNLVDLKLVVEYSPDERDGELEQYLTHRDQVPGILEREVESLTAQWVAGKPVDDVLLSGRAELPVWLLPRLANRLAPARLGILVHRVSVEYLASPREVIDAFQAVNQAQNGIATRVNQASQESAARLRDAEATKFRSEQQAEAYRRERVSLAAADADSFRKRLEQYHRIKSTNPQILAAIWWEELGRMLITLKARGRLDVLDQYLGPDGLDITQIISSRRK